MCENVNEGLYNLGNSHDQNFLHVVELSAYTPSLVCAGPSSVALIIDLIASVSPQALRPSARLKNGEEDRLFEEPAAPTKGQIRPCVTRIPANSRGALRGVYRPTSAIRSHQTLNIQAAKYLSGVGGWLTWPESRFGAPSHQ